jgi:magnesium transporter
MILWEGFCSGDEMAKNKVIEGEKELNKKLNVEQITWDGLTWVNIEKPTTRETEYLAQNYPFHPLDLDGCLSRSQRPKIDEYEDYLFIVLHFPLFSKEARVTVPSQVSIFVGEDYLVTLHQGVIKPLLKLFRDCQEKEEVRQEYVGRRPGYLLYRIVDMLVDYCFPIVDKVLGNLEGIEDMAFDQRMDAARDVALLRRDIAAQRRIIWSLRDVIIDLERKAQRFTKLDVSVYFGDINDHLNHLWGNLEEAKETVEIYKDTDYILSQDRLQKIMAILTVFMATIMPIEVIASVEGSNALPGSWHNNTTVFGVFIGLQVITLFIMLYLFRRRHWI